MSAATYRRLLLDAGQVRVNYVDADNPGFLLGATRGGSAFTIEPEYHRADVDGAKGPVKGDVRIAQINARMQINALEIVPWVLSIAIPGATTTESATHAEIKRSLRILLSNYNTTIALLANISGSDIPVVCILKNALSDGGFGITLVDADETTLKIQFTAHFDPSDLTSEPWEIRQPLGDSPQPSTKTYIAGTSVDYYTRRLDILVSDDGQTYTIANVDEIAYGSSESGNFLTSIAYNGSIYVAAGQLRSYEGEEEATGIWYFTSTDKINWTKRAFPIKPDDWEDVAHASVAFGNGVFVMNGRYFVYTSTDGINWTYVYDIPTAEYDFNAHKVLFGNGRFVVISDTSAIEDGAYNLVISSSPNGTDWTIVFNEEISCVSEEGTNIYFFCAFFNDTKFIITLKNDPYGGVASAALKIVESADGTSWTVLAQFLAETGVVETVTFANGQYLSGARGSSVTADEIAFIGYSENGVDWSYNIISENPTVMEFPSGIVYNSENGVYTVYGSRYATDASVAAIMYSTDLVTWTPATISFPSYDMTLAAWFKGEDNFADETGGSDIVSVPSEFADGLVDRCFKDTYYSPTHPNYLQLLVPAEGGRIISHESQWKLNFGFRYSGVNVDGRVLQAASNRLGNISIYPNRVDITNCDTMEVEVSFPYTFAADTWYEFEFNYNNTACSLLINEVGVSAAAGSVYEGVYNYVEPYPYALGFYQDLLTGYIEVDNIKITSVPLPPVIVDIQCLAVL